MTGARSHRMIICRKCLLIASSSLICTDVSQKSIAKIATVSPFTVPYDGSCRGSALAGAIGGPPNAA